MVFDSVKLLVILIIDDLLRSINDESDEERPRSTKNKKQGEQMETRVEEQETEDQAEVEEEELELVEGKSIETVLLNLF